MKTSFGKQLREGLVTNNPIFVQFLGMCSALAITTSVTNAIGMGLSVTAVLICSNLLISLLRRVIMPQVRIAAFIVIISGFVTAVELLIKAYLPALDKSLGLFIPLIVVNCIIFARAESFASKNPPVLSIADGLGMGLGFTLSLFIIGSVRELLGSGTWMGITVTAGLIEPMGIFTTAAGGFFVYGILIAVVGVLMRKNGRRPQKSFGCAACPSAAVCHNKEEEG